MITSLPVRIPPQYPHVQKPVAPKPVVTRIESPSFNTQKALASYLGKPSANDEVINGRLAGIDVYV